MLDDGIIERVEESKNIILMVVKDKKTREVWICINLNKLNDVCLHNPFPTPFTYEVLEGVRGK